MDLGEPGPLQETNSGTGQDPGQHRQWAEPSELDRQHGHHASRQAADGTHRQIDFSDEQHKDHTHRDRANGRDLDHQIGQVQRAEEMMVGRLEDGGDDTQPNQDRQGAQFDPRSNAAEGSSEAQ